MGVFDGKQRRTSEPKVAQVDVLECPGCGFRSPRSILERWGIVECSTDQIPITKWRRTDDEKGAAAED